MGKEQKIQDGGGRGSQSLGREFSAGGVVYKQIKNKKSKSKYLWLVRATSPSKLFPKTSWTLPKGWLDDSDTEGVPGPMARGEVKAKETDLQKAALREVREEAGVEAKIIKKIGHTKYIFNHPEKGRIFKVVTFYLMEYVSDILEGYGFETSEVAWLPYEAAYRKLSFSSEKQIIKKAQEMLSETS